MVQKLNSFGGGEMTDRANSPAYQMLPRSARRVFAAIERAIGDRSSASVSYTDFSLTYHIGRQSISVSLKLLSHLGLIEVEPGVRLCNRFKLSNRWRTIDEVEAKRLAQEALPVCTENLIRVDDVLKSLRLAE
jgi:hypothetical protein